MSSAGRYGFADGTKRCARQGCSKFFRPSKHTPKSGPRQQKYCSPGCKNLQFQYDKGQRRRIPFGECKNGHERTFYNTYVDPHGVRSCRECKYLSQKTRRARKGGI